MNSVQPIPREEARRRLTKLRHAYEPNVHALAAFLALDLPPWLPTDRETSLRRLRLHAAGGRDLVG